MRSSGISIFRATRSAHSARRVLCTPVLMSFRSSIWLKAQTRELRKARCCSSSSLIRSTSPATSGTGLGVAAISFRARFLSTDFLSPLLQGRARLEELAGLNSLERIQSSEPKILVAEVVGIGQTDRNYPIRAVAILAKLQCCRTRHERRAERCAPSRGISSPWISGDDALSRGSDPHRRRAIIGK